MIKPDLRQEPVKNHIDLLDIFQVKKIGLSDEFHIYEIHLIGYHSTSVTFLTCLKKLRS